MSAPTPSLRTRLAGRAPLVTAVVYTAAWVLGLVVAPASTPDHADTAAVGAYYSEHGPAVLLQSLLVHGIAGVCLALLAFQVGGVLAGRRSRGLTRFFGTAAPSSWCC